MKQKDHSLEVKIKWFDPLDWLFIQKLKLGIMGMVVLEVSAGIFERVFFYTRYENYTVSISYYFWVGIALPIYWGYYAATSNKMPDFIHKVISSNSVFENNDEDFTIFIKKIKKNLESPIIFAIAILASSAISLVNIFGTWNKLHPPYQNVLDHKIFVIVMLGLSLYVCSTALLREGISFFWIYRLFKKFPTKVIMLHPDRAGGLGFIGNFVFLPVYLIVAIGYGLTIAYFISPIILT